MLDVEWALGVAPAVRTVFWSVNVSDPITFKNSFILEWALQVRPPVPRVHATHMRVRRGPAR